MPFYLYDPSGFSPLHVASFAIGIPYAQFILPLLALCVTGAALFLPPGIFSLFGLLGLALAVLFVPISIAAVADHIPNLLGYSYPVTFWAGMWLLSRPIYAESAA